MKTGFVLPGGDARLAAELAYEAELAGWDSFFVWEPVWGVDAWVCLTAAAMRTQRIRLGTMLSPLSRMRPWKLASESAMLAAWRDMGATWWLETMWGATFNAADTARVRRRIRQGPPAI